MSVASYQWHLLFKLDSCQRIYTALKCKTFSPPIEKIYTATEALHGCLLLPSYSAFHLFRASYIAASEKGPFNCHIRHLLWTAAVDSYATEMKCIPIKSTRMRPVPPHRVCLNPQNRLRYTTQQLGV